MSLSLSFLSLSLSSCLCSVSIYSPLLCCTPQLPVFCSFGLFSLHLLLPFLCLPPPFLPLSLLSAVPPSVADCSGICVSGGVWAELSQQHTQEGFYRDTMHREKQLSCTPPAFLSLWHLLHLFPLTVPSHVPPEDKHRLLTVKLVPTLSYLNLLF